MRTSLFVRCCAIALSLVALAPTSGAAGKGGKLSRAVSVTKKDQFDAQPNPGDVTPIDGLSVTVNTDHPATAMAFVSMQISPGGNGEFGISVDGVEDADAITFYDTGRMYVHFERVLDLTTGQHIITAYFKRTLPSSADYEVVGRRLSVLLF